MDILSIEGLHVKTRIGVYAWEQSILQTLRIDITIPADFSNCDDKLENTIDYARLCQEVSTYLAINSFKLIETVAERLMTFIQREFNVSQLTIRVSKPQAIKNAANVSVTISR